ncbi:LLM class flavin-dependent oxidoreductase [Pseudonocardia sp. CA-142604]|uniref:LLM class flavin-dependent oxidoreductase n=1 Tax=Pseudonocardia sp. CA-142604 TaxID=3240024 RepID=UPI003D93B3E8
MAFSDDRMIGVSINNLTGITGHRYGLGQMLDAASEAEALGFDGVWVHDAPLGRRTMASYDSPSILAAVATRTRTLKLCTGILQPHLRNPVALALTWATIHGISEGRLVMGVGTGAGKGTLVKREYSALAALRHKTDLDPDVLYAERGRLFTECMDVMNRLWREDKFSYHGEFYHFDEVTLGEARPQTPPPTLMGSGIYVPKEWGGPASHMWKKENAGKFMLGRYKRVVNHSDGWIANHTMPEEFDEGWAKIKAYAAEKHPGKAMAAAYNCFVHVDDNRERARDAAISYLNQWHTMITDEVADRWIVTGPAEEVAEKLADYQHRGVTIFQLMCASPDQREQMRRIGEHVVPLLR